MDIILLNVFEANFKAKVPNISRPVKQERTGGRDTAMEIERSLIQLEVVPWQTKAITHPIFPIKIGGVFDDR